MISKEEILKISKLAKLNLTDSEIEELQNDMASVLGYIDQLKEVDIDGVDPMSHAVDIKNQLKEDKIMETDSTDIIKEFPEKEERLLKVKSVFKNED